MITIRDEKPQPLSTNSTGATPDAATLYRALLASHPEPMFSLDRRGAVLECNRAFARFVGRSPSEIVGTPLDALVIDEQRAATATASAEVWAGRPHSWQADFSGPDGTVSVGYVTIAPVVVDDEVVGAQGVARDVTVYQVIEEQLKARVLSDPLTGLANRTQLHEAIERACRRAADPTTVAVLFLDVDDFKLVNDALGHVAGDALLSAIAERLRRATRGNDLVARLGGDEFAVLLDCLATPDDALRVVERVHASLRVPIELEGRPVRASASIGVAHWEGVATADELLRNADLAMYRAKAFGKGGHVLYDANMQRAARERLELASDLRAAIQDGALTAAFQPVVDLETGRVCKVEALARWTHPTRGPVSPGVFVPLAEEMGLIEALGAAMLREGCRLLRARQLAGAPIGVAVNVSGRQIERGTVVDAVREALAESGADPRGLTLELTESVAMRNPEHVLQTLNALTALGVSIAIDDFGTGYSSLAYLHRFPVNVLKVDKSFVDGLGTESGDEHARAIVRTVLNVASSLGLKTVAEGVETEVQRDVLRTLGCDMAQGYLFGRPGPAEALR